MSAEARRAKAEGDYGVPGAAKNTGGGALACRAEAQRRRAV